MSMFFLDELATIVIGLSSQTLPAPTWKWASTESQSFQVLHPA